MEELAGADGGQLFEWLSESSTRIAVTSDVSPQVQRTAIEALALASWPNAEACYRELLAVSQPPELQTLALRSLAERSDSASIELIVGAWQQLGPSVKSAAIDALLGSTAGSERLLTALETGVIAKTDIDAARRRLMEAHPSESVRKRAVAVFGATPGRKEIVEKYRAALMMKGDRSRGQKIFHTSCAACHRVGETGHEVGPSLAAAMTRGAESVLVNVLDPNQEVNPQYLNYVTLTTDGRTISGMVAAESAGSVTLRRGEGASEIVLRSDIEQMRSTEVSLMPEGLEQQIDPQGLADLLEFLRTAQ
jgi:putative heme-binding domain-containing protein